MKILIHPHRCLPFHGHTLEEKPMGGIETAIIRLAKALDALGHQVIVLTPFAHPPLSRPLYLPLEAKDKVGKVDLLIAVRGWEAFWEKHPAKKRLLWTGDSYTNPHSIGIGDPRVSSRFDALLCVSRWQAETLCSSSGYSPDKVHILRNGVDLDEFKGEEARVRKRLIFASNPQRGLIYLPLIYVRLKQKHPELELHIFSNAALLDMKWPPIVAADRFHHALLKEISNLPGCYLHGTIIQSKLAREFMKSSILVYPANGPETSCITIMEAQAGGCSVVTTALGALEETVGEAGFLVREEPGTQAFVDQFVEKVDKLLSDDGYFQEMSRKSLEQSRSYDWKLRARELLAFVQREWGLS